jgi:murein DD-endopeptidase MepM/ murein hydrolase activator NlpD
MNRNFFENMQEQIEPSERLLSLTRAKIAAKAAPKRAASFVKWLPLTAAACVIIAACVLILPMVTTAPPYEPYENAPLADGFEAFASMTPQEIENMTDEEFLSKFLSNGFNIPDDIYMPSDFGIPLAENEHFIVTWLNSDDSIICAESAERVLEKMYESKGDLNVMLEPVGENEHYLPFHLEDTLEFIGENDYYTSFRIAVGLNSDVFFRLLLPKDSMLTNNEDGVVFIPANMLDKQSVTTILDFMKLGGHINTPYQKILYRSVEETDEAFIYTCYAALTIDDDLYLTKMQSIVCRLTGEFLEYSTTEELKVVPSTEDSMKELIENTTTSEHSVFIRPLPQQYEVTEWHWNDGGYRGHSGIDFDAPHGTAIFAAGSGTVVFAGRYNGYGNTVVIEHTCGLRTWYAHCSEILVTEGQEVTQGEIIAEVGSTGRTDGAQLHFEVRSGARILNPRHYLQLD